MTSPPPPATSVQRWSARVSGALFVLTTVFVVGVMAWAGGWADGTGGRSGSAALQGGMVVLTLLFVAWAVSPLVMGVWVVMLARRWWPRGLGAVAVAAVVAAAFTVVVLRDFWTSDSSTAALIFVFLPFYLWLLVGAAVAVAALLQAVLVRRAGRETSPG